jgi:putative transposase
LRPRSSAPKPPRTFARRAYRNWFGSLSGRRKGSANRARARHRVAVLHRTVRETRLDHAHKIALRLARDNQAVYAEDLCVSGLARTRLARSVHDAGWSQLLRLMEEKAAQYGRTFARIGRFEPTSQVCSACGVTDGPKPLSVRQWTCAACGTVHDRDVNAAKNILAAGRADNKTPAEPVQDHALWQPALKQEPTGTRREPRWRNPRRSQREDVKERPIRPADRG